MDWLWNMVWGWEEILITQDINRYMTIKAQFNSKGIITKTRIINNSPAHRTFGTTDNTCTYYLYIKKNKKGKDKID